MRFLIQFEQQRASFLAAAFLLGTALVFTLTGCAPAKNIMQPSKAAPVETIAPSPAAAPENFAAAVRAEQIRTDCIQGRRVISGKILKIAPDGLVVDSGYDGLTRPPLGQSWVVPGNVSVRREQNVLELNQPDAVCIGLVFLTDIPKRPKPKLYDYVVLVGYPAGNYIYAPMPDIAKNIRRFAAGVDTAVKLNLQAELNAKTNSIQR